jgi:hypothetical protein
MLSENLQEKREMHFVPAPFLPGLDCSQIVPVQGQILKII